MNIQTEPRFGCPKCGSEAIRELNSAIVLYPIDRWNDDGTPGDYGPSQVVGDTAEAMNPPYWCRDCSHEFAEPKRLPDDEPEEG